MRMTELDRDSLLTIMLAAAEAGAAGILAVAAAALEAETKPDASPVTSADRASEAAILAILGERAPGIAIVSEESASSHAALPPPRFFLVDPLDGTKELIAGRDDFTVNVALIEDTAPVLGVVVAPRRSETYWTEPHGGASMLLAGGGSRRIAARPAPPQGLTAIVSRSHSDIDTQRYLARLGVRETMAMGSSLKLCLIARGDADVYPRLGPTHEWDTAAADAVLRAAGGQVEMLQGGPLRYGKPGLLNGPFVAWGRKGLGIGD